MITDKERPAGIGIGNSQKSRKKYPQMTVRKIVHIDLDAFCAFRRTADNSELRGKPVIVAWLGNRSVVCAASCEVRKFGLSHAGGSCGAIMPRDDLHASGTSHVIERSRVSRSKIFSRHTDLVEPLPLPGSDVMRTAATP
jgi:DNA polymerase IV